MIFPEFIKYSDRKELKGFDQMTCHVTSEHLNHSTSKPQVTDMIFKLTLIHAPLFLSDSLNVLADPGGARDAPPGFKFFHFHAVFGQKMFYLARPLWELASPGKSWIIHWNALNCHYI